jgi:hypothetical protein
MRTPKMLLFGVVLAIVALIGRPKAAGPSAAFHSVGDLTGGGSTTMVRDATKANGVIFAVGGAVTRLTCGPPGLCPFTDTAILWQFDGTNATLQALPDLVSNTTATSSLTAFAMTPDAAFIAGRARSNASNGQTQAVRATTSLLPSSAANVNLSTLFAPTLVTGSTALATSSDGTILYGSATFSVAGANQTHSVRFDTVGGTSAVIAPLAGDTQNTIAPRGSSAAGDVAVGSSFSLPTNHKAFRYVQGSGSTQIPLLTGGTYNDALAVGPAGDNVLVVANSAEHPNGEVYVYSGGGGAVIERYGSPNALWAPGGRMCIPGACQPTPLLVGGMAVLSSTTRVVAMNFSGSDGQDAFIHNPFGWFHLESVLLANGVDLTASGWNNLVITGISPDATLVYGFGAHNGSIDGFVAEFGSGVLAAFNPAPVAPTDTSIVGAWGCSDPGSTSTCVLIFTVDGAYYHIQGGPSDPLSGFERGYYTFDGSQLGFTTLLDTNGSTGASGANGSKTPATTNADTLTFGGHPIASRLAGLAGTLAGAWVEGDPTKPGSSLAVVFTSSGKYLLAWDDKTQATNVDGIEIGQFTWDSSSGSLVPDISQGVHIPISGGGDGLTDFVSAQGPLTVKLSPDGLGLITSNPGSNEPRRIIDPATIPVITNAQLSASGTVGQTFSYTVTSTNTVTFGAAGLPNGLSMDSGSGQISGTPTVGGQFSVTIFASNSAGVSDFKTLVLTIAIPTPVGSNVTVQPDVPAGQGPVTMTFGNVTSGGTTTVTVLNLDQSGVPPPGSVQVGGVVYEVETTAHYTGLIQLCFSYAHVDFGSGTPRLFHYENNAWVDITTGVNASTQTICGATTSLSPFAVLVSHVVRTGFYRPVNPIPGFLNTVKRDETVPLKFNVYIDGVEKKTTDGLQFTVASILCDSNAPQETVASTVAGETSLRYDLKARQFIQNWKVPKKAGCYMVRMTTAQDGLALTARFKVK